MTNLNEKEAYTAMYAFLDKFYQMTKSDDVGGLLGGMSFLPEGSTADPAVWDDWLECVAQAKQNKVNTQLFP